MNTKIVVLLLLFVATFHAKSYVISEAHVDYHLNQDGSIDVTEEITYRLSGTFQELYLQKPPDLKIRNESGMCEPREKPCRFFTQSNGGWHELVVARDFSDETVTARFSYTLDEEILEQKDTAQFFYQAWGAEWQNQVGNLEITVHLPGDAKETTYFVHSENAFGETEYMASEVKMRASQNEITLASTDHAPATYVEINLLMPKEWFFSLRKADTYMTKAEIIEGEKKEEENRIKMEEQQKKNQEIANMITLLVLLMMPASFVILYMRYGREKSLGELGYNAVYEREPPQNISAAEAEVLRTGSISPNSISAELLYLAKEGHLEIEETAEFGGKKAFIRTVPHAHAELLKPHQLALLTYINTNAINGRFNLEQFDGAGYGTLYDTFSKYINGRHKEYFNSKGNNYFAGTGFIILFGSFLSLFIAGFLGFESLLGFNQFCALFVLFIEFFLGILLVASKPGILGKFTPEGRVISEKCKNFAKFLSEYTLLKERKITDITVWETYLVYATAFGISEKVLEVMKLSIPESKLERSSSLYRNRSSFAAARLRIGSATRSLLASRSRSSGGGRSGGGFGGGRGGGGGGGGAR